MSRRMAFTMDQAIHKAGLGAGEVWQGENLAGGRGDGDATGLAKTCDGIYGIGFRELIESLKSKVCFSQNEIADMDGNPGSVLFGKKNRGDAEQLRRLSDQQPQDAGGIETDAWVGHRFEFSSESFSAASAAQPFAMAARISSMS